MESFDFDNKRMTNIGALQTASYGSGLHKIELKMLDWRGKEYQNEAYLRRR